MNVEAGHIRETVKSHWEWIIPIFTVFILNAPVLLTHKAFWMDFTNAQWMIDQQSANISHYMMPSYFVSTYYTGVFSAFPTFYGGSAYAIVGGVGALIGSQLAFSMAWLMGFVSSYGGCTWLSLQSGLTRWRAQIPGLVFVTSAYYLTNLYGRGDFGEFLATSMIPLVVASATNLLHSDRWRPIPVIVFVGSVVIFTGSHSLTLLYGTIFLAILAVFFLRARWRRIAQVAGLTALSASVNAWFMVPTIYFASRTQITHLITNYIGPPRGSEWFNSWRIVFDPLRAVPTASTTPGLYVQLPVLILLWVIVVVFLHRRSLNDHRLKYAVVALGLMEVLYVSLIIDSSVWRHLPHVLQTIQYPYRLTTYAVLAIAGLMIGSLILLQGAPNRVLTAFLIVILLVGGVSAVVQVRSARSLLSSRSDAITSHGAIVSTFYDKRSYNDASSVVMTPAIGRAFKFNPSQVFNDTFSEIVNPPQGSQPFTTNIASGSYLVTVTGLKPLGRTVDGFMVVERKEGHLEGPILVTLRTRFSPAMVVGRALTVVATALCLLLFITLGLRSRVSRETLVVN